MRKFDHCCTPYKQLFLQQKSYLLISLSFISFHKFHISYYCEITDCKITNLSLSLSLSYYLTPMGYKIIIHNSLLSIPSVSVIFPTYCVCSSFTSFFDFDFKVPICNVKVLHTIACIPLTFLYYNFYRIILHHLCSHPFSYDQV